MTTTRGFLTAFLAVIVISAVTIRAQSSEERPNEGHWWCSSMEPEGPVYVTGLWSGSYFFAEVGTSFAQELLAKYAFKGRINCHRANVGATAAQIQSGPSSQITAWRSSGRKVIEIPWIYDPAKAALPHLCMAYIQVQKGPSTYYLNKILRIPGGTQAQLTTAWSTHIKERHPGAYIPVSGCNLLPADPAQQQTQLDGYAQMYASQKPQVVRYDWSYEPALPAGSAAGRPYAVEAATAPAPPSPAATSTAAMPRAGGKVAPPAAPSAAPQSIQHAICYGDAEPTARYFSGVFDGTRGDYADWMPAFQQFLVQTYKYRGFVRCNKHPSQAAAQKFLDNLISSARSALQPTGAKMKVVETGWIYK